MATDAKRERLRQLSLFKGADETALDHLSSAVDEVTVEAGHTLIRQGSHHSEMFVLASGSATVEIDGNTVAEIPSGEFVGELSFFNKGLASATVTTAEQSEVMVIPYNRFDQILADNPTLVRTIVDELAERLEATTNQLRELSN